MKKTLKKIAKLRRKINTKAIKLKYKIGVKSFTRKGKMNFTDLVLFPEFKSKVQFLNF